MTDTHGILVIPAGMMSNESMASFVDNLASTMTTKNNAPPLVVTAAEDMRVESARIDHEARVLVLDLVVTGGAHVRRVYAIPEGLDRIDLGDD